MTFPAVQARFSKCFHGYLVKSDAADSADEFQYLLFAHGDQKVATIEKQIVQQSCQWFFLLQLIEEGNFMLDFSS